MGGKPGAGEVSLPCVCLRVSAGEPAGCTPRSVVAAQVCEQVGERGGLSRNHSTAFLPPLPSPYARQPLQSPCPVTFQQHWPWPLSRAWEGRQPHTTPWGSSAGRVPALAKSSICLRMRRPVPAVPSPGVTLRSSGGTRCGGGSFRLHHSLCCL